MFTGGLGTMSSKKNHVTAPQDRVPFIKKLIYGSGAFVNNLLADSVGRMLMVLNIGLGMNPAIVGLLGSLPRLFDAFTDPLMGYISDNTRTRWGRRRPFIFVGAIVVGLSFALLWQLPIGKSDAFYFTYFLVGSLIFYVCYTIFVTPWVALGYELTPDYDERTRLMGTQNFVGQIAYLVTPWFMWVFQQEALFDNMVQGAGWVAIAIGATAIAIGILPAIFLRERVAENRTEETPQIAVSESFMTALARNMKQFFSAFATTMTSKSFLQLCAATFLVFNGFMLIASFQSYVIIYYVYAGDIEAGLKVSAAAGTLAAASTFAIIFFVTWLGTHVGKRKAFFISISLSMVGYALKWICYQPENPWLALAPVPLMAFGLGSLFTLMPAMIADVVDADELETNERREGMYGSIFWWITKLGMAAAILIGGVLLHATGFDEALKGNQTESALFLMRFFDVTIPLVASGLAIWAVASFSITEERAHEIRTILEERRGAMTPV